MFILDLICYILIALAIPFIAGLAFLSLYGYVLQEVYRASNKHKRVDGYKIGEDDE